jgi:MGT family glycosyltransferase
MRIRRRILVVTLHAAGNWPPELELIRALTRAGHHVRVVSDEQHASQIVAAGAEYRPYRYAKQRDPSSREGKDSSNEMLRIMREVYLNSAYADELLAEVARDGPDVLLVDQMLWMASVAAERTGLPTATLWHTVYIRAHDLGRISGAPLDALNALRTHHALPTVASVREHIERVHAILAFTYSNFDAASARTLDRLHYVGPLGCTGAQAHRYVLPWPSHDLRPLILVSYSTTFQDQVDTLQRIANAVANLPARVLMTLGEAIRADELRLPDNVVAEKFVPHGAVLPCASLVVTHAGHGTVMSAVTAGVPMVCTPMGRDQHAVAACVQSCGLGVLASMTASSEELRGVIGAALQDDALHGRARMFAANLDVEAGLRRAVELVETLSVPAR